MLQLYLVIYCQVLCIKIKTINVEIFVSIFHCYTLSAWNSAWNIRDKQKNCLLNE